MQSDDGKGHTILRGGGAVGHVNGVWLAPPPPQVGDQDM